MEGDLSSHQHDGNVTAPGSAILFRSKPGAQESGDGFDYPMRAGGWVGMLKAIEPGRMGWHVEGYKPGRMGRHVEGYRPGRMGWHVEGYRPGRMGWHIEGYRPGRMGWHVKAQFLVLGAWFLTLCQSLSWLA